MAIREKKRREKRMVNAKQQAEASKGKSSKAYKMPGNVKQFSPKKEGTLLINIVPFEAGAGNPGADEGALTSCRLIHVHNQIGPNKDCYQCLARMYNEPCPVCEHAAELEKDPQATKDMKKPFWPQKRQLWLVEDTKDAPDEVMFWDVTHFLFGEPLEKECALNDKYYSYASQNDDGYTLQIEARNKKIDKGREFLEFNRISFKERKELTDEVIDKAFCVDDCVLAAKPSYEFLKHQLHGTMDEEENGTGSTDKVEFEVGDKLEHNKYGPCEVTEVEEDGSLVVELESGKSRVVDAADCELVVEEPSRNGKSREVEDDDDEPKARTGKRADPEDDEEENEDPTAEDLGIEIGTKVKHKKHGICEVVKISGDGTSLRLEDGDMTLYNAVAPSECQVIDPDDMDEEVEDDEDEAPKRGKRPPVDDDDDEPAPRGKAKAGKRDLDFDDDETEEDDDDEPPAKKPGKTGEKK